MPAASDELEHRARLAIELVVLWRGDVLAVRHLSLPGAFYLGDARSACDVALPDELLGSDRVCVAVGSRNEVAAVVPLQANGWLTLPDGSKRALPQLREQLLPLGLGHRAHLCFANIEVQVAAVSAGRAPRRRRSLGFDGSTLAYFGLSSLSVAGLLAALSMMAPPLGLTQDERISQERLYRLQSYLTASAERVLRQQEQLEDSPERAARAAAASALAAALPPRSRYEPPAQSADPTDSEPSAAPEPLPDLETPDGAPRTASDRKAEIAEARNYGIIGLLKANFAALNDPRLHYKRELTGSELAAMEQMYNGEPTWDEGPGGLALSGTGLRGGGKANPLPLEALGTVSGGEGTMPEGFAHFGDPSGSHRSSPPQLRADDGSAPAPLSTASLRRTINAEFPRIRACYEEGLRTNPALPAKALVSFVLLPEGHADQVSTESDNLPPKVVSCIEGVFRGLSFPSSPTPVPVRYPIQLTP